MANDKAPSPERPCWCGLVGCPFHHGMTAPCAADGFMKTDSEKPRVDLIPKAAISAMGRAFGYGAKKYAPGNWKKCREPERYAAAAIRHLYDWLDGDGVDESGLCSLDHAIASVAMLVGLVEILEGKD